MSNLRILSFQYSLSKLPVNPMKRSSFRNRQFSDLMLTFEPDITEMQKVFDAIAGTDGKIRRKDLQSLLVKLGEADNTCEARRMMQAVDLNKDGFIDFDKFMGVHKKGVKITEIKRAFFVFDRDADGRISANDLKETLLRLGESHSIDHCERMVKEIARNGDGLVDMDDFMTMMTRPRKKA